MLQERISRVRRAMEKEGIGQLIVTAPQNLTYLTGTAVPAHDRLNALVISEKLTLVCYSLAVVRLPGMETVVYEDADRAPDTLASVLKAEGTGVDGSMASRFLLPLQVLRPDIHFSFVRCVEMTRSIKDADEIARLARASEVTDDVFRLSFDSLEEGMTELDIGDVFSENFEKSGAGRFPGHPMVAVGEGTADVHHIPGSRKLKAGDPVMVDTGMQIDGYYSDMTRTVFFRSASEKMREVYEVVRLANEKAREMVRPGITLRDIHETACSVIRRAGFGDFYTHRTSHGIGIDYHEEPFDTPSRTAVLLPGMCFSVEPGIYLPGEFGVRIEDIVTVTDSGCRLLNHVSREMTVIGEKA